MKSSSTTKQSLNVIRSNPPGEKVGWKVEPPSVGKRSQLPDIKGDGVWFPPPDVVTPGLRWRSGESRISEVPAIEDTWFMWNLSPGQPGGTLEPKFQAAVDLPDFTHLAGLPASIYFEIGLYSSEPDFKTDTAWAVEIDLSNALMQVVLKPLETSFISPYVASFRGILSGLMKNTPVPSLRVTFDTFWGAMPNADRAVPIVSNWFLNYTYPVTLGGVTSDAPVRLVARSAPLPSTAEDWEMVP